MNDLKNYITERFNGFRLSGGEREKLLKLDKEYGMWFKEWWDKWDRTDCKNTDSEFKKFIEARKSGKKYYPQLELVVEKLDESFIRRGRELQSKFRTFNCFLSKYYIQNIQYMIDSSMFTVYGTKDALAVSNHENCPPVPDDLYDAAWKMLREHPYMDVRDQQPHSGPDIVKEMQAHIKKMGYDWHCELNPDMIARQNVVPNVPVLHIKTDARFSDIDLASLKIHEVEVHVARRHYGLQTGLYLFLDGLYHRNTVDEGCAIYNSLTKNPMGVKPNLEFDIAIKTVIAKHIMDMDFIELFDWLVKETKTDQNKDIIEFIVFKNLCRFKRVVKDCSLYGGDAISESDYFCGYMLVKDMTDEQRQDLIKYNIGPGQIDELDDIKKFFSINKFKPLSSNDILNLR